MSGRIRVTEAQQGEHGRRLGMRELVTALSDFVVQRLGKAVVVDPSQPLSPDQVGLSIGRDVVRLIVPESSASWVEHLEAQVARLDAPRPVQVEVQRAGAEQGSEFRDGPPTHVSVAAAEHVPIAQATLDWEQPEAGAPTIDALLQSLGSTLGQGATMQKVSDTYLTFQGRASPGTCRRTRR